LKILLDHCVPKPFGREFPGHEVKTAFQMGWANLSNGDLLAEAAGKFDALVTVDQNIRYQRNLSTLPLPVLILLAGDNDPETVKPFAPFVLAALSNLSGNVLLRIHADGRVETIASRSA
jgi:hypothetical protein